ncbi:MAG: lipid A deacylase LpxR family protein [Cardiobacteriaceae bacterium]|nr:lipid A deacylase LpxR family protein [Cardiobacteriaceae bacterium]
MRILMLLSIFVATVARADEINYWRKLFPQNQSGGENVILETDNLVVEKPTEPLVDTLPDHILRSNERFFTINIENDKFGSGYDRDYTNGLRMTWFNVGAQQPFYVNWIDRLVPTFDVNKTTSTYFSFGHNLYTPSDIDRSTLDVNDRPYAAFLYGSTGISTITDRHMDDVELTLGWIGPSAQGEFIQDKFHRLIHADYQPHGWKYQLRDEPAAMLSWERSYPAYFTAGIGKNLHARVSPHYGVTLGNVYTYANAGFVVDLTPTNLRWQTQPVRVRPAIPGSGYFEYTDGHGWMLFLGYDARLMARNIFLDGNTWKESHRVNKEPFVQDFALGAAYNHKDFRISYTANWRSREFESPLAKSSSFGAISVSYRF